MLSNPIAENHLNILSSVDLNKTYSIPPNNRGARQCMIVNDVMFILSVVVFMTANGLYKNSSRFGSSIFQFTTNVVAKYNAHI